MKPRSDGSAAMKDILGGKGAGLAEMTNLGIPVPPGFTIATTLCLQYLETHQFSPRLRSEVERALLFLEEDWPGGRREFQQAVDGYAEFEWQHMRTEEEQLLPLAERYLDAQDWSAIGAAFAANTDPIAGVRGAEVETLFARIAIHTGARS